MKKEIPLEKISCTADRDQGDLQSLIQSITATNGLLQPILLREVKGSYFIYDGRRRFAALQAIGRKTLKENEYVLAVDEIDPRTVSYVANTERKMLTPLEEANQICAMLKQMTAEEIAEKLGKTLNYVVSRSRLAELKGAWRQVLAEPDKFPHWTIGKLQMIAREPEETQKEIEHLLDDVCNYTLNEIWEKIQYYHRQLENAPFIWQKECSNCPKRSDRQGVLFAEDELPSTCLDGECYEQKCLNAVKNILKENPKLQPVRSGNSWGTPAADWADKNKVPRSWEVQFEITLDSQKADGIICCGENIGKYVKITRRNGSAAPVKTSADKVAEAAAEKARKADTKKQREILRIAIANFCNQVQVLNKWSAIPEELHDNIWKLILSVGINASSMYNYEYGKVASLLEDETWLDRLLTRTINKIVQHSKDCATNPQLDITRTFEQEICKAFEWNWQDLFLDPAQREYEKKKH